MGEGFSFLHPGLLGRGDMLALGFLLAVWLGTGHLIEHPPARHPSVSEVMKDYRRAWMRAFLTRDPRIFDASIIGNLRQGTAFFASATMIAIGGTLALLGNPERVQGLTQELALTGVTAPGWEARLIVVVLFVTDAFLNFVWSHRLFGYCAIVMAAVPNDHRAPDAALRAGQAAELNISAAKNFNRGLRSVYFAIGSLAWLIGPVALALATGVTAAMILRREFWSQSRRVLLSDTPK